MPPARARRHPADESNASLVFAFRCIPFLGEGHGRMPWPASWKLTLPFSICIATAQRPTRAHFPAAALFNTASQTSNS